MDLELELESWTHMDMDMDMDMDMEGPVGLAEGPHRLVEVPEEADGLSSVKCCKPASQPSREHS
jgi:hypothetical protein